MSDGIIKKRPKVPSTTVKISVVATTARVALTSGSITIRLCSTTDCYYKLGDITIDATTSDVYLPADVIEYIAVGNHTYIAAIRDTGDGTLTITKAD